MAKRLSGILFLLLLPVMMAQAQGVPDQVNAALANLSQRVGQTLTLNELDDWRWSQDNYSDTSLGCAQPGSAYAQVITAGYKFLLTYSDIIYDYRVSADSRIVILCSQTQANGDPLVTPTSIAPEAIDTSIPCPSLEPGVTYLPVRLTAGIQARVVPGPPNNQRSDPRTESTFLGEIPGGSVVEILAGPQCANQLVWWQVDYDGRIGWTVEGRDGTYWLEQVPALPLAAERAVISAENADLLNEVSMTEGNFAGNLAVSPNGSTIAVLGGLGTGGVWLYDLRALDQSPGFLRGTTQITSIDYNSEGTILLLGDLDGNVRLWDTSPNARLLEITFLQGHQSDTSAVAYSPDDETIASVGSFANTLANVNKSNAVLLWDVDSVSQLFTLSGHNARVNGLEFSPDGTLLASASGTLAGGSGGPDNSVRLWNTQTGEQVVVLEGHTAPIRDIEFTPDGTQIVSAGLDGAVIVWDIETGEQARVLRQSGTAITTLGLNPEGTLLAIAGGDPNEANTDFNISLWDFEAGEQVMLLEGHTDAVRDLAFSSDGTVLISLGNDLSLRFWGVAAAG